jgi:hypothetical protein
MFPPTNLVPLEEVFGFQDASFVAISFDMADFDPEDWDDEVAQGDQDHQRIDRAPDDAHKLKPWTVVALILNRTIGKLRQGSTIKSQQSPV